MVRIVTSEKADTATEARACIQGDNNTSISSQTIRNMLKHSGLRAFAKMKNAHLNSRQKRLLFEFAKKYVKWIQYD
jgi:hypothetical protein